MTDAPALLKIENLTTVFGGLKALSEVSLEIVPGQAIGLVGPNGSGKTTLVNTVCAMKFQNPSSPRGAKRTSKTITTP